MKYIILSDIHGSYRCLCQGLERFEADKGDMLLLLGDLLYHGPRNPIPDGYDPQKTAEALNGYAKRIIAVHGNCDAEVDQMLLDFPIGAPYVVLPADGHKIVATHGHLDMESLCLLPGDLLLHGHTHLYKAQREGDVYVANPGSITLPKDGRPASYGVLEGRELWIRDMSGHGLTHLEF